MKMSIPVSPQFLNDTSVYSVLSWSTALTGLRTISEVSAAVKFAALFLHKKFAQVFLEVAEEQGNVFRKIPLQENHCSQQ